MKLIFLDFDGVLNSDKFFHKRIEAGEKYAYTMIDDEAIDMIVNICETTGAKIVVSSSWRYWDYDSTISAFKNCRDAEKLSRIIPYIIGVTPRHNEPEYGYRGEEIKWFIDNVTNNIAAVKQEGLIDKQFENEFVIEDYIILDDDNDMLDSQKDNFIRTDEKTGLTSEITDNIIARFSK